MNITSRTDPGNRRHRGAVVLVLAAVLTLMLAACGGGSDDGGGVASADGSGSSGKDSAKTTTTLDPEEGMLRFARCMRENGVDMPDPSGDGQVLIGGDSDIDPQSKQFKRAQAACENLLPDVGSMDPGQMDEIQDQLREVAACMRDKGFDVPDPVVRGAGDSSPSQSPNPSGDAAFDPNDPDFQAAQQACSKDAGVSLPGVGADDRANP